MTAYRIINELQKAEAAYRAASERAAERMRGRDEMIRAAIAAGWTHKQIADATGLTRGRVNQIKEAR